MGPTVLGYRFQRFRPARRVSLDSRGNLLTGRTWRNGNRFRRVGSFPGVFSNITSLQTTGTRPVIFSLVCQWVRSTQVIVANTLDAIP